MVLVTRLLVAAAVSAAVLATNQTAVEGQTYSQEELAEWIEWLEWELGETDPRWVAMQEYMSATGMDPWLEVWRWNEELNDRAHREFIDYIWDRDPRERYYDESYGYGGDGYGNGHYGYGPTYSMPYPGYSPTYTYPYWDPMASWYRSQAANDRAHRAFIDYIRN